MRQPALAACDGGSDGAADDDDDDSDDEVLDTPVNSTYEAMKLVKEVTTKANDVILDMTRTFTRERVAKTPQYLPVSSFAIKNTRRKMEDRHIILRDLNTLYDMEYGEPHAFYGVFDGHAGSDAAMYTAAHLHQYLIQNPLYHLDPVAALKHAFHFADTNFLKKAKKERLKGGTTAVVALLREKRLAVAWLGDSLAVLVRKRQPIKLVEPHKPDLQSERDRVNNMGGVVVNLEGSWRILGQLAVSRAIGDADYKPFVSSECDIKSLEIVGDEDFLILATDGLWDTLSYEEAVSFVYAYLTINQGDCEGVGRCLVEQARRQGSQDNITAVVVFLRPVDALMEEEAARREAGEIPEGEMDPSWVMKKDAAPSTIYEIFSNNVSTFNPDSPTSHPGGDYNPFSPDSSATADPNGGLGNGSAAPPSDFGGYEQIGGDYDLSAGLPETRSTDPTMEDVESALAELDSLPDGDNDPSSEQFENNVHDKQDAEELATTPEQVSKSPAALENGDPSPPSSPRSVEGFVTSVELNTAQEQYSNIDRPEQEAVEQQSGPFSVYVSSSPEPASLDPLSNAIEAVTGENSAVAATEEEEEARILDNNVSGSSSPVAVETAGESDEQGVEIVHAQSVVEVEAPPSPTNMASPQPQSPVSEELFIPQSSDGVSSPAFNQAPPLEDLMSTSMILEKPISDAPEQVEEMMQFVGGDSEVKFNSFQESETAQVVHISSDSERIFSPETDNLLDGDHSGRSSAHAEIASPNEAPLSPLAAPFVPSEVPLSPHAPAFSPRESPLSPEAAPFSPSGAQSPQFSPSEAPSSPPLVAPRSPTNNIDVVSPDAEDILVEQMNQANLNASYQTEEAVCSPEPVTADLLAAQPPSEIEEMKEDVPVASAVLEGILTTPVSDVMPSTPIKAPMIDDRPVSPIHTPKADIPVRDEEIISEIPPPKVEEAANKKAPVKPAPRTTGVAARPRAPLGSAKAPAKSTTPSSVKSTSSSSVKPGTPRPTTRTTPGSAVRSTSSTTTPATAAKATPTTRTTARTPLSARSTTTPTSRSTSGTSTRTTTTTTRTQISSRTGTPSATRTTPSSSATRATPGSASARPASSTRPARPGVTSASTRTTPSSAPRTTSSRPSSATTTPTTARRVPISRRPATATAAKDATDSKPDSATTRTTTTARVPLARKPLYPGPKVAASAKPGEADKKDIKNNTNKQLSSASRSSTLTRTTTRTTTNTAPTHKPIAARTTTTTRKVTTTTTGPKSRTAGSLKSKTAVEKSAVIAADGQKDTKEVASPETKGEEVKMAQEESNVEVLTKEVGEIHLNGDAEVITTTTTTVEQVLVNGDGDH